MFFGFTKKKIINTANYDYFIRLALYLFPGNYLIHDAATEKIFPYKINTKMFKICDLFWFF